MNELDKQADTTLGEALSKYAEALPEITARERLLPYLVGEPTYRAIYAPHGEKLDQYGKGGARSSISKLLGGLAGMIAGAKIADKYWGAKHWGAGGALGLLTGAGLGAMLNVHKAPEDLRETLKGLDK